MEFTEVVYEYGLIDFMTEYGGFVFAVFGAAIAAFLAGIGSARACGLVGEASAGLISEEPEKFGQALILQLLPGTQGLYGFIISILIAFQIPGNPSLMQGLYLLGAALPVAIVGYISAIAQAKVSVSGLQILAKNPAETTKGIIFAVIVETYAILGFVMSIILLTATMPA